MGNMMGGGDLSICESVNICVMLNRAVKDVLKTLYVR
jgi:hypothetical protein